MKFWWNRFLAWYHRWPSWSVVYEDGHSYPLRYADAATRCKLFDGLRVVYVRDVNGNLLTPSQREVLIRSKG